VQAATWEADAGIECDGILSPADVAPSAEVTCRVADPKDLDERIAESTTYPEDTFNKPEAFAWKAADADGKPAGEFPKGNIGQEVLWVAPKEECAVTLSVTVTDDAVLPKGDDGSREDCPVTFQVSVSVGEGKDVGILQEGDVWWIPFEPIQSLGMMPWRDKVYGAGTQVQLSVDEPYDWDFRDSMMPPPMPEAFLDSFTFTNPPKAWDAYKWTATAGMFVGGVDNVRTPTWLAPDDAQQVTFTVTIKDDAEITDGYPGTRDDPDVVWEASLTVAKADIDIAGLTEQQEKDPGGYLAVNGDDDDGDGIVDKDDPQVANEDDLFAVIIQKVEPEDLPANHTVRITWGADEQIDVFESPDKSGPLDSGAAYNLDQLPKTLYVEGDAGSDAVGQVEMKVESVPSPRGTRRRWAGSWASTMTTTTGTIRRTTRRRAR